MIFATSPFDVSNFTSIFYQINYTAVLLAGLLTFAAGAFWYSVMFGNMWAELNGFSAKKKTPESVSQERPPAIFFGGMIGGYMVLALAMAYIMVLLGIKTGSEGCLFGFLVWAGPVAMVGLTSFLNTEKHIGTYLIDLGFQFCYMVFMGGLLGWWHRQV